MSSEYVFPSSFGQKRLWFLDQLVPNHSFYNIHTAVPFDFQVNIPVLERALAEIARRHETLRTSFREENGEVMQVVHDNAPWRLQSHDLSRQTGADRAQELLKILAEQAHTPFNLAQAPLFRTALIQLSPASYRFVFTIHHIIADAWSMAVFFRELGEIYGAFLQNRATPLPELEVQYADFSVWQADYLKGEVLQQDLDYWRQALEGCELLDLPTDHPRPPMPSFRGASHQFELPASLVGMLNEVARRENCTLFMVLLAAYKILLYRYTAQTDLVVGVPVANRNMTQLESLIGFFVNTLVLRTNLADNPSARQALGRVREAAVAAYAHQNLPFEKLVDELQPERDLSRNPLFQLTFQLHNEPGLRRSASRDPEAQGPVASRGTSNFDIAFDLWLDGDSMVAQMDYATDLFEPETIARLACHYLQILYGLAQRCDLAISELPLLLPAERNRVLYEWNATDSDYPSDACIHELFEEIARTAPERDALRFRGESMGYGELNRRADRLAMGLQKCGVGPDNPVALCVERSPEMVIGLLAILKAGGAYLGLDPKEPLLRLQQMVEDSGCRCLLTVESRRAALKGVPVPVLAIDQWEQWCAGELGPVNTQSQAPQAQNLAYICYTSGSTGQPKGVEVTHRNVVRLVRNTTYLQLRPDDVFMLFAPLSFDASTFEIWGALLNGAALAIQPPGSPSLSELGDFIEQERISILWLTSGLFHQMVDAEMPKLAKVRCLFSGGDVLSPRHVRRAFEYPGQRVIVNAYGPTEGATFATCHVMTHADEVQGAIPIGRPVSNSRIYLLDTSMNPVPIGVAAELYVGGDGVSRGYLNRPELTPKVFLPDPFSPKPGARMYRSGDLARWRSDGTIDFLRRIDRQVKIRGFRVELGETESALRRHPQVREAFVRAVDTAAGKVLVAYVVAPGLTDSLELRRRLEAELPAYMIPSEFFLLDEVKLKASGKLDTASLPTCSAEGLRRQQRYAPPRTEVEQILAPIWSELLGVRDVGIYDDFFMDLRGHSLLGTQLVSRVRSAFQIDLPLRAVFERPTIATLAEAIEEQLLSEIEGISANQVEGSVA